MTRSEVLAVQFVASSRVLTNPQLARLMGVSEVAVRRHTKRLADQGVLRQIPNVTRVTLAPMRAADDPVFAEGSAPRVFTLSAEGVRIAQELGLDPPPPPEYRERAIFLGHDVLAQEVRVVLVEYGRAHGCSLLRWETGPRAYLGKLRPDAWFAYRLPQGTLVGFVEADRGSEGRDVWKAKQAQYTGLLSGDTLYNAIGYERAWVVAVTETAARATQLTGWLEHERLRAMPITDVPSFLDRFAGAA